jgi:outer membrane protein OmpA-like peptidoglycan-associated protein
MTAVASFLAHRRRWIHRDALVWPFLWRGALPLLGLLFLAVYATGPFAHNDIQASVRQQTRLNLRAQGFDWVDVAVSGQDVVLRGQQPVAGAGERALDIARATACATWAGFLTCPVVVSGEFGAPAAVVARPASAQTAVPPEAPRAAAAQACEQALGEIVGHTKIEFATASARIRPASEGVLDALAKAAANCPGVIRVEGFTDSVGSADSNQKLSETRARAVTEALERRGIAPERLVPRGYGAERPIGDNATAAGRADNRRIEFHVDP